MGTANRILAVILWRAVPLRVNPETGEVIPEEIPIFFDP